MNLIATSPFENFNVSRITRDKPHLHKLSADDHLLMLELSYQLIRASGQQLQPFLQALSERHLPPSAVLAVHLKTPADNNAEVSFELINLSFPDDWIKEYINEGHFYHDPIKSYLQQNPGLDFCSWGEILGQVTNCKEILFRARLEHHQLTEGITLVERQPQSARASYFSFGGREIARDLRAISLLRFLLPFMDLVFRNGSAEVAPTPPLSTREKDILSWAMYGKTNGAIADALHISERTVKFHVQNIMRKLNASNRAQAVAIALQAGAIMP